MKKLFWQRLILRGFGCYEQEFVYEFSPLSLTVQPNESGKSTLAAGLAAVIFGLPASGDPARFGQARFRNRKEPPEFSGELFFKVGPVSYHLLRDFATHRVELRRLQEERWLAVPGGRGVDNPGSAKALPSYRALLGELIGITSLDVFLHTFYLTQPLPGSEGLDAAVQGLLAGTGQQALRVQERLENEVRALTRYYGEPLGRLRDGNKDRVLEELDGVIAALERSIEEGAALGNELRLTELRLNQLASECAAAEALQKKKRELAEAWQAWRGLQQEYEQGFAGQQKLQRALQKAYGLATSLAAIEGALEPYAAFTEKRDWDIYLADNEKILATLLRLEEEQLALQGELERVTDENAAGKNDYLIREEELKELLREAEAERGGLVGAERGWQELWAEYSLHFADLRLTPKELYSLLEERRALGRQATKGRTKETAWLPWLGRLGALVVSGALYYFFGREQGDAGLLLAAALFVLLWLLAGRLKAPVDPQAVKRELVWARYTASGLGSDFFDDLLAAEEQRPAPASLEAAEVQLADNQRELATLLGAMATYGDLAGRRETALKLALEEKTERLRSLQAQLLASEEELLGLGFAAPIDWQLLQERYGAFKSHRAELQALQGAEEMLFSAHDVADLAAMEKRMLDLTNDMARIKLLRQQLVAATPELPQTFEEYVPATGEVEPEKALAIEIEALQKELEGLRREENQLHKKRAELEGRQSFNIAAAEMELRERERERQQIALQIEALGLAYRELTQARADYSQNHRERLAEAVNGYFQTITGCRDRYLEFDDDFALSLADEAGRPIHLSQLSQGARDQLYLSLRLAIADHLATDVQLPFILDDPFVNCDSERLLRIGAALEEVAKTRQIWLLSHSLPDWDWS